jgi:capsule polysaccharide export protein KpsE/RkpR
MGVGLLGAGTGGLISQRTPGQTVIGVLTSNVELDYIIDKFNLRSVYHKKYIEDARKALLNHSDISEDKKSGILQISVTDKNKQLAHDIAAAYVDELNQIMNNLGTSSAKRERLFLEQRLKDIKTELDSSTLALSQFSSHNATIDIQKQAEATLESADRLQAQLIAAESELSGIKTGYTENSPEVRAAQARISELQQQLNSISGAGQNADSTSLTGNQVAPSIRKLPLLGAVYADLYRKVTIEEALYETLSKQYELARVEEAKEIPPVRVLGSPTYPEKKSAPRRSIIVVLGAALACFGCAMWILAKRFSGFPFLPQQAG